MLSISVQVQDTQIKKKKLFAKKYPIIFYINFMI